MGHNFNRGAINICHSYKKLKKIPTFFPNVNVALLYENLSCAKIQSLGWKYFVVVRNIYFATWEALHCTCVWFFPLLQPGFSEVFLLSHNAREIAGWALPNIMERP